MLNVPFLNSTEESAGIRFRFWLTLPAMVNAQLLV
jgi:hypothetical protein